MNKKNLFIALLLVLLLVAAFLLYQSQNQKSTLNVNDTDFAADTSKVTTIFIAYRTGVTCTIEKQPDKSWVINKQYKANPIMMNMLLSTMSQLSVKAPVSKSAHNNVVKELATGSAKVEVYYGNEKSKTYYVGNPTLDNKGTYAVMEGSDNPYIIEIKGFNGNVSSRFLITKEIWKDKEIFRNKKNQIESISVQYPSSPDSGFIISKLENKFIVENLKYDTIKLMQYIALYQKRYAESFIDLEEPKSKKFIDSLKNTTPFAIISLKSQTQAKGNMVKLFPYDIDRFVGFTEKDSTWCTVQHYTFDPLLVSKTRFISR